jgi:hypothetical protein
VSKIYHFIFNSKNQTKTMKKLLFALLFSFLSYGAMAQAGSLYVRNYTNCWVYYIVMGGSGCNVNVDGSFIALAPGGTVFYPNAASVPGFPAGPNFINAARPYDKPTSCTGISVWRVGEICTGMLQSWTYRVYSPSCLLCNTITASWTVAPMVGGTAQLAFN